MFLERILMVLDSYLEENKTKVFYEFALVAKWDNRVVGIPAGNDTFSIHITNDGYNNMFIDEKERLFCLKTKNNDADLITVPFENILSIYDHTTDTTINFEHGMPSFLENFYAPQSRTLH